MENLESYRPRERFSDRAGLYAAFRPSYPPEVMAYLKERLSLLPQHMVADIGAGTGLFAKPLLENGNRVLCVEPNREMREEGMKYLKSFPQCGWSDGSAEVTMLKDHIIDLITCAQAFHWFNPDRTQREFQRIGKQKCVTLLIWNTRLRESNPFMKDYDELLCRHGKDYGKINDSKVNEERVSVFFSGKFSKAAFQNRQILGYGQFSGRAFSSSYMPKALTPEAALAEKDLTLLFEKYQKEGRITFEYETRLYHGKL